MKIAVVGGGLGGLAAAHALLGAGHDVHVLEEHARAGGVIGTSTIDGYVREHAASSFLGGPPQGALALCEALGVPVEQASSHAKRRWIYIDGKLRALPRNPIELIRSDLLTWRGKLDLVREPFRPARTDRDHDESMHAFAARRLGAEAARAIVAPAVTGVYAADAHAISLAAGFPRIAALEADGGLVRGLAKQAARGLAGKVMARVTGKRTAEGPSRTRRGMFAPTGGLSAMIEALSKRLGDRLRLATQVETITATPGAKSIVIDGETFDAAVLAIPAHDAADMVNIPELATRLRDFHRAPAALVYLGFPATAAAAVQDGFGALVAQGEDVRVLGFVFESTVWTHRAPAGHVLVRCIMGGGRDPDAASLPDGELIAHAVADAGKVLGITAPPVHASVVRWPQGIAQYPVGHRDRVRSAVAVARAHRIVLAGADYQGPAVNDLCADAARVVDEVHSWAG